MNFLARPLLGYRNLIVFTAYYFSTPLLISTFFSPWKRYSWKKSKRGFHPSELLYIRVSNIVSRIIGIVLRTVTIVLGLCGVGGIVVVGLPFSLLISLIDPYSHIFSLKDLLSTRALAADWHFGYTPLLDKYSEDLYEHQFKFPLVDRKDEIATITRALTQESEGHIVVIGEPGSGRHSLIVAIAKRLVTYRFMLFNYVSFFKDKQEESEKEAAIEDILEEAVWAGNIVLVVDHFENFLQYAHLLENYVDKRDFHLVAITNPSSYNEELLPNQTLMKHFETVAIEQMSKEYVREAVTERVNTNELSSLPESIFDTLTDASYQLISLEAKHQPEAAITLLDEFTSFYHKHSKVKDAEKILNEFLEHRLKVPFGALTERDKKKLRNLEYLLGQRIIGQEEALSSITKALRRKRLALSIETKPIGSFLFVGPTGVGKTETAKALASIFFEDEKKLLRFDMARYQEKSQVTELLDELASRIRNQPYGVLLLDEIEKAHKEFLNILLTILDEGYFHDSHHNQVLCNNLIIIATSNAASEYIRESVVADPWSAHEARQALPTGRQGRATTNFQQSIIEHLLKNNLFSPEFINRFDAVVAFSPLSTDTVKSVIRQKLSSLSKRVLTKYGKEIPITTELIDQIAKEGSKKEFGAREIERTIKRLVEDKIAEELLK